MAEEPIKQLLKDSGLTETETELYLFLSKHGALKGTEIAKQVKKDKAQVYHILRSLQAKGLVESTLEAPVRFTPVPFERVVESTISAKRAEAERIESAKNELLRYWKSLDRGKTEILPERFTVIEGRQRVYSKISQMIQHAKRQLLTITTVSNLIRAEDFGLYDAASRNPLKSQVQFRLLTELSSQNVKAVRALLTRIPKTKINFKGRNLNLGLKVLPQMVMRDEDETLFFITPKPTAPVLGKDDVCLWTNCKALVQAFSTVFEDLWRNSTEIEEKLFELEAGGAAPTAHVGWDAEMTKKEYEKAMRSAREEILMLTTSEGLTELSSKPLHLEEHAAKGVFLKIMAPVVKENWEAAKQLSKFCAVRHVPTNYLATTIVDGEHLFQFRSQDQDESEPIEPF